MIDPVRIGVISDTHGRLPRVVFELFAGVSHIVHAGDVGVPLILSDLETIAPVTAVWGNTDGLDIRSITREEARLEIAGTTLLVVHGHQVNSPNPLSLSARYPDGDIVVFGHSHRPLIERHAGRLFVNPGSAGAPRFGFGPSVAMLELQAGEARATLLPLDG